VRYTQHPGCFIQDFEGLGAVQEKIGFIDIETNGLNADFSYMICWSLKELDGEIQHQCITPGEIHKYKFDKGIIKSLIKLMQGYDRLIGYYSKDNRFDIPFLRTRALKWGLDFPQYRDLLFTDVYDLVRPKLKLHRNRLETACDLLQIPSKQHRMNPDVWLKAMAAQQKALDYIQEHCDEDVISLEAVYKKLYPFGKIGKTSI